MELAHSTATTPSTAAIGTDFGGERDLYPWETHPAIIANADTYLAAGQVKTVSCKVDEFLEGLIRSEVFRSIRIKPKQRANLAALHVFPDLVGIAERPERLGCLTAIVAFLFPFLLPLVIGFTLLRWAMAALFVVGIIVVMLACFGPIGTFLLIALFVAACVIGNRLYTAWTLKRLDAIARRIRENPKSSYAVKQMYKRSGWVRWRTGIGHGQTGAEMTARFWQQGDVEQLIRVDVTSRFLPRSLLLIVMDNPLPRSLGWRGIGIILMFYRLFQPHRRIYVVDIEGGTGVADSAAQAVSQVLGRPVERGQFGFLSLTVLDR